MTHQIRPEVIDRVRAELAEVDEHVVEEKLRIIGSSELTRAEKLAIALLHAHSAVESLRDAEVLREPPSLLERNYRELAESGRIELKRGHGLLWLLDQLGPLWASRPERTLADVLKIERPRRVAYLARELRHAGIHDIDELAPPDLMTGE
jgi:hypothetical protein